MIRKIFITVILFTSSYFCFACKYVHFNMDTLFRHKRIYIVEFSDKPTIITKNLIFDPRRIEVMTPLSDSTNSELRKILNVHLILRIKFIPETELLNLFEVLKLYNIDVQYLSLPLMIDDEKIDYPQTLLIAKNQIKKVEIVKSNKQIFIRIITI